MPLDIDGAYAQATPSGPFLWKTFWLDETPLSFPGRHATHLIAGCFVDSFTQYLLTEGGKASGEAVPCGIEAQAITNDPVDKPGNKLVGTCGTPSVRGRSRQATRLASVK